MKRFYKAAAAEAVAGGWQILLDGRTVKTPARAALLLPREALAGAIVAEWAAQRDEIQPRSMPMTGLANAAIDRTGDPAFLTGLVRYAEADLLCYRAEGPDALLAREAAAWDPLLGWAMARFNIHFEVTSGIIHVAQPPATVERLADAVGALDRFALAGLSPLVTIGGSLVVALAVREGAVDADAGFEATLVDERWQAEQWGEDAEAASAREARRAEFLAAARFLRLTAA